MRAGYLLVAILPLIFMLSLSRVKSPDHDYQPFQGTWHGQVESKAVQLEVESGGSFHWMASAGQARAEGDGCIRKVGADFLMDLPFIDRHPLKLEAIEEGRSLNLSGQSGMVAVLSKE